MSDVILVELIKALPGLLWALVALVAFLVLRRTLVEKLVQVRNVKTAGVELTFAEQLLDEAAANAQPHTAPTATKRRATVSRLEHAVDVLKDGRILWVNDNPDGVRPLVDLFRRLNMTVETARSTDEALPLTRTRPYDIINTDMRRDTEEPAATAGLTLIEAVRQQGVHLPVIVLAAAFDPTLGVHPGIFAYTNRSDELVHLVIDVMERVRFGAL
jgi:CheY-like chemotaxis protein